MPKEPSFKQKLGTRPKHLGRNLITQVTGSPGAGIDLRGFGGSPSHGPQVASEPTEMASRHLLNIFGLLRKVEMPAKLKFDYLEDYNSQKALKSF